MDNNTTLNLTKFETLSLCLFTFVLSLFTPMFFVKDQPDHKVQRDLQEKMENQEVKANQEQREVMVYQDKPDHEEMLVHKVKIIY